MAVTNVATYSSFDKNYKQQEEEIHLKITFGRKGVLNIGKININIFLKAIRKWGKLDKDEIYSCGIAG